MFPLDKARKHTARHPAESLGKLRLPHLRGSVFYSVSPCRQGSLFQSECYSALRSALPCLRGRVKKSSRWHGILFPTPRGCKLPHSLGILNSRAKRSDLKTQPNGISFTSLEPRLQRGTWGGKENPNKGVGLFATS